jgi:uncharacterized membrane protein
LGCDDVREYDRRVKRKTRGNGLRLETTWSFLTKYGAIGMVLGALIGLAIGNLAIGLAVGFIAGAVGGLIAGWQIGGRIQHDLEVPAVPPPGGWRRWDDEDDRD